MRWSRSRNQPEVSPDGRVKRARISCLSDMETPAETLIGIDTFTQVDLRVGQIVAAERVPNADKLLRLEVDLAETEPRQLLAGIAEWYAPESLVGQKIIVVSNLQP